MGISLMPLICGCVDNERDYHEEPDKLPKEVYFDFNTNQSVAVDIDYGFQTLTNGEAYRALFEIYTENPIETNEADGTWEKTKKEPLYRGVTNKQGQFDSDGIVIPSDISEVWLYSAYLGTASPVKLTIGEDHRISFNQNEYIQALLNNSKSTPKSRAITGNNHDCKIDWLLLPGADWDANGRPNNLSAERNIPPASVLYNIKKVFEKSNGKNISNYHPEFFTGEMTSDVPITKKTKVSLVFANSSAGWYNTVGYFTYPTGTTPTEASIKKILAFPNASPVYKAAGTGALVCGDEVQLKYWNEETGEFEDEFPAGVTIGWCLQGMGFIPKDSDKGNQADIYAGMGIRYSTSILNPLSDGVHKQRTVSLRDANTNQIVAIGFEDNIDMDYCDAIFYISVAEKDAIDEGTIPSLPEEPGGPTDEENYFTRTGILSFEDLWPSQGDYDMNDVMIRYTSKVYKSALTNRVYKIVDKFVPLHCGGYLKSGFGYQLSNISNSDIAKVTMEMPAAYATKSQYMPGETEAGQSHPTILLFDNITVFKNKDDAEESTKEYTITIEINDVVEKNVMPPYNPFIFINSDKTRGKEVHLANYAPTDKADLSLLGTGTDASRPEEELYYVSNDLMPFALNMPVANLPIPEETVRIDESYPKFAAWAKSNGTQNKDWYKFPKK